MMNRRTALKNLSLSIGYVISAPALMNMITSCTEDPVTWQPTFLTLQQKNMVIHLVDIILPNSDIPGGLDVNIPEFIDKMYKDVETESKQEIFSKGSDVFSERFQKKFDKDIVKGNREEIHQLFSAYFDLSETESNRVLMEQRISENKINAKRKDDYVMYKFLFSVRSYSLFGYYTSEKIGKEVLNYDPIPGGYEPCIPLSDIGNAWTL